MNSKANKIIKNILGLVEKDIKRIKKEYNNSVNEDKSLNALTMSRYVSLLLEIEESNNKKEKKDKIEVNSLSTEELIEEYKKQTKSTNSAEYNRVKDKFNIIPKEE